MDWKITQWREFMFVSGGQAAYDGADYLYELTYEPNFFRFRGDKLYFGCGPDGMHKRYDGWDLCDLRLMGERVPEWDIRLGIPCYDGQYAKIKSKQNWGMLTYHEAEFLAWEITRALKVGGIFEIGFRNLKAVLRMYEDGEITATRVTEYLYGCSQGQYNGSIRKSAWNSDMLRKLFKSLPMKAEMKRLGPSTAMTYNFTRTEGEMPDWNWKPRFEVRDERVVNIGGGDYGSELKRKTRGKK